MYLFNKNKNSSNSFPESREKNVLVLWSDLDKDIMELGTHCVKFARLRFFIRPSHASLVT